MSGSGSERRVGRWDEGAGPALGGTAGSWLTDHAISRRAFVGWVGTVAAGATVGSGLVAACGQPGPKAGTRSGEGGWTVEGARATPEVILTTSEGDGEQIISVYDTAFGLLRRGRLRPEAYVAVGGGEWQAPTLSFPYKVREGGNNPYARSVLRRVDLESGADELVFTGDTGRWISEVVSHPTTGGYVFSYLRRPGPQAQVGSEVVELWSASPGSAERIRFEDSYLAVVSDAETDPRENPNGWSPLAGIRPVAVTPDGRYLFFARNRLYVLEFASGKVEQVGTRYRAVFHAEPSPDGTRVAVRYQDPASPNLAFRVAIVELSSGRAQEIQLPAPLETSGGVWHPDGKRLACTGELDLYRPDPKGGPRGLLAGKYSAVFLVDVDTGAVRGVARDPSAPSAPPRAEDFRIPQDYRGHLALGFSRDGRTLFVREDYLVPKPTATTTTTTTGFEEEPPEEEPPPGEESPVGWLLARYTFAAEIVAVDVETNRRERVLTGVDSALLLHR